VTLFAGECEKEIIMPIERLSPELERIASLDQEVEVLGRGFVGGEGPLWWKEGGYLLFSEVRGNRRMKWSPEEKVDVEGNVYCTGPGGIWIMDSSGQHLGTIVTGVAHTTNLAWGGEDWKTLFITTPELLTRIQLKIPGIPGPR
jgi:sugar lactone lactonase YvrE